LTLTIPLYFGISHLHHLIEFRITHPNTAIPILLIRLLFQFAYTTLFGWFAQFVFLRTGNVWACVVAHGFCNFMGLPRVWGRVGQGEGNPLEEVAEQEGDVNVGPLGESVGDAREKKDDDYGKANGDLRIRNDSDAKTPGDPAGRGPAWTVGYYVLLVLGAFGFWKGLWPLTESGLALGSLYK
jgi:prenyl protein peptidase